jgi:hypothetical protein
VIAAASIVGAVLVGCWIAGGTMLAIWWRDR